MTLFNILGVPPPAGDENETNLHSLVSTIFEYTVYELPVAGVSENETSGELFGFPVTVAQAVLQYFLDVSSLSWKQDENVGFKLPICPVT